MMITAAAPRPWPVRPIFRRSQLKHQHNGQSQESGIMRIRAVRAAVPMRPVIKTLAENIPKSTTPPQTTPPGAISSNPNKRTLEELTPSDLCYYWDTKAPTPSQLTFADKIFTPSRHSPLKIWSASKFRTTPLSSVEPEVAFLGRSNVGKSSLLNAIMGQNICWTSSKPGRTREMNAFGIGGTKGGEHKVVLLDMPGYGKASRAEWGLEIMKYLQGRKQ